MSETSIKAFQDNADHYINLINKIGKKVQRESVAFLKTLDTEDGHLLPSNANLEKVLLFQAYIKKYMETIGYDDLVEKFIADVPELVKLT